MMVDLQNLRNAINEGGFSEEAKNIMLPIVDAAITRGSMTAAEKKKLQDIMEVEIDSNTLQQNAHEDAAEAIESFLTEVDAAAQTAEENFDELDKEAEEEIKSLQNTPSAPAQVPGSVTEPMAPIQPESPLSQPPTQ